jgi:YD repeat-containing protein
MLKLRDTLRLAVNRLADAFVRCSPKDFKGILVALCCSIVFSAAAQTVRYYDRSGVTTGSQRASGSSTQFYGGSGRLEGTARENSGTVYYYDRSGASAGSQRTSGGTTSFYDSAGRLEGTSRQSGTSTYYYDRSGAMVGSARASGNAVNYYDRSGRMSGHAVREATPTPDRRSPSGTPKPKATPDFGRVLSVPRSR